MALSFHQATYASLFHLTSDADMGFFHDVPSEVTDALLGFVYDPLDASNAALDTILDPLPDTNRLHGELCRSSLSAPSSMLTVGPDVRTPSDGYGDLPHCPKRPRSCDNLCCRPPDFLTDNSYALHGCQAPPEFLTEFVLPLPAFGRPEDNGAKKAGGGCLSAQSVAARERRKRISEKTQELGRLIPGGHKLNTAEMLQEAAKHVKLLQAQVGMLALMRTIEKGKIPPVAKEQLQVLLGSSNVQERLSAEGKCLVPKKLVEIMAKDKGIKSNALVSRDLDRFMESQG